MTSNNDIDLLNLFIRKQKDSLNTNSSVSIALGNEAADLDSMVSSIIYSYLQGTTTDDGTFVPVINIPRADFKLRTEASYLLKDTGIDETNLIFIDEIDLGALYEKGSLKLTLIDHNVLSRQQQSFSEAVTEIIDHHNDENNFDNLSKKVIEPVGSCATLVASEVFAHRPEMIGKGIAKLLLGTILLDTVNLDPEAKRVTDKDSQIAKDLLLHVTEEQDDIFNTLQFEKFNVESLSSSDLLRKDYKEWEVGEIKFGISSVLLPVEKWIQKDETIENNFNAYIKERDLDILIAMNAYTNPEFHREMVIYSNNIKLKNAAIGFLNLNKAGLEEIDGPASEMISFYSQQNDAYSRKKLQPILADLFSKYEQQKA